LERERLFGEDAAGVYQAGGCCGELRGELLGGRGGRIQRGVFLREQEGGGGEEGVTGGAVLREDGGDEGFGEGAVGVGRFEIECGAGGRVGVGALGEGFEKVEAGGAVEAEDEGGAFFGEGAEPIQAGGGEEGGGGRGG
jgi:hypothetical protein